MKDLRLPRCVGSLGLVALLAVSGLTTAAPPWGAPFRGEPSAMLAAASAVASDPASGSVVLLEEGTYTFDEKGRLTQRLRYVVRVVTPAAVEEWSTLERSWAPWHQTRPELKARVITSDGIAHELDPKTISDAPAADYDPDLYTDRRVVRAPLPALAPGAIVEEEVTLRDSEPAFAAGTVNRFYFGGTTTEATRLVIRHPASLPLRTWSSPRLAITPTRTEEAGTVTLLYESARLTKIDHLEPGAPGDVQQTRVLHFSTGESWNAVARAYAEVLDRQLGSSAHVAAKPPADRDATIRQVLARIQREIRYTGVEFSEASIVPRTPAETVTRRYGDCKDKAALLVARLREAGIPAVVALVNAGPGPDVRPELPGLAFDHVIVHVPAGVVGATAPGAPRLDPGLPPVWIDPTDEFARAGELPLADQGRLVLLAEPKSTELVRTPESTSSENRRVETRVFVLQDDGPARVVETREATGSLERSERDRFSGGNKKELQDAAEAYTKDEYLSKGAVRYEAGDPRDLVKPFRLRFEADKAGRGVTDDAEAVVVLFPAHLFSRLPRALRAKADADEDEEGGDEEPAVARKKNGLRPRTQDFVLDEPFVDSWTYRVVPPPGYVAGMLPESSETPVGTGKLSQSYRVEPDGAISAAVTFDSGKRRLTAAEFEAYRTAVAAEAKRPAVVLRFVQSGMVHLQAGRIREALVEFRRLAVEHPKKAVHRSQIAIALLQGGLGDAARAEARRAVEIEPGSARAQKTLGWVLQHDVLGRRFGKGFDRAGALAAYRKARELDPKDAAGRADLAILLEHDGEGVRYGPGADLAGAIAEYQAIRKELKESSVDVNLFVALYQARRFDELAETVKAHERTQVGDDCLVLCAAAREGADAARREAARLMPEASRRREGLERVAQTLIQLRMYPPAAALLAEAASGSPRAADLRARGDLVGRVKRWDAEPFPEDDPRTVARRFYVAVAGGQVDAGIALFTRERARLLAARESREQFEQIIRAVRRPIGRMGVPHDTLLDLLFTVLQFAAEGSDAQGYRIRIRGSIGGGTVDQDLFVVKEGGAYRLHSSDYTPSELGAEALLREAAGDHAAARLWLDWAREDVRGGGGADDPLAGSPFARLWTRGLAAEPSRIRLASLVLATEGEHPGPYVVELEKEREAEPGAEEKRAIDLGLARGYTQEKRWADLLTVVSRLEQAAPESDTAFRLRQLGLVSLGRIAEARRAGEERLARRADDPLAIRNLAQLSYREGDLAGADALLRRLVDRGSATAGDYNELAWAALFAGPPGPRAIEDGQHAVEMSRSSSYAVLHTMAALYAEVGQTTEARELILKALELSGREEPASTDWYVLGRLAEQYGENAAAVDSYRKVEAPEGDEPARLSTWTLAQSRLKALGAATAKAPARGAGKGTKGAAR